MKVQKIILSCFIGVGLFTLLYLLYLLYFKNNKRENFSDLGLPGTNHTVNLPINTSYECENKCMPPARCSITGEQCQTDIDCCGCNSFTKQIDEMEEVDEVAKMYKVDKMEQVDKMQESFTTIQLSSAYGNDAINTIVEDDTMIPAKELYSKPPQYFLGIDNWSHSYYEGAKLFNNKHDPNIQRARYPEYLPTDQLKYPTRGTLSGLFVENGPLTINDY